MLFGLSYLKIGVAVAVAVAMGLLYWQWQDAESRYEGALQDVAELRTAVDVQHQTINELRAANAEWKQAVEDLQRVTERMVEVQIQANEYARRLNDVLADHDLEALSIAKPGLIENRINAGTADTLRVLDARSRGDADDAGGRGEAPGEGEPAESGADRD